MWGRPVEGVEERGHVLAQRRRVGDVEDAVEALAPEPLAQAPRGPCGRRRWSATPGGQALGAPAAVEDDDLVAAREERTARGAG